MLHTGFGARALILLFVFAVSALTACKNTADKDDGKETDGKGTQGTNVLQDEGMPDNWTKEKQPDRDTEVRKKLQATIRAEEKFRDLLAKANSEDARSLASFDGSAPFAFSSNGARLATRGPERTILVWEIAPKKLVSKIEGGVKSGGAIALSPDGELVANAQPDSPLLTLWSVKTGAEIISEAQEKLIDVTALAFSPDGQTLAVAGSPNFVGGKPNVLAGSIILWDVGKNKKRAGFGHFKFLDKAE